MTNKVRLLSVDVWQKVLDTAYADCDASGVWLLDRDVQLIFLVQEEKRTINVSAGSKLKFYLNYNSGELKRNEDCYTFEAGDYDITFNMGDWLISRR